MADGATTNYGWIKPEEHASDNTWGAKTNANWDSVDTDLKTIADSITESTPPGSVMAYAGATIPTGWLECDGSPVSRALYDDLFTAIGVLYGAGNGTTTFNLPDLRGEFVRGWINDRLGFESGRALASTQSYQVEDHTHALVDVTGGILVEFVIGTPPGTGRYIMGGNPIPESTDETRPRNVAMQYMIKT